ncbi:EpsG family protein [Cohnella faecalis]|uniref:EpsG family protein n=1 Tax=Cohnella faecalis TaxID=2315694 RepID=A0A398CP62_9BACL|nr:EpsG family protein [Cohnella faecalis]RIE04305.1 EpsG family protein [Cohnella faecalis]
MIYFAYSIVVIINSFLAYSRNHSRIIAFITAVFIWLLFWSNTLNPDLQAYVRDYIYLQNNVPLETYQTEPGFIILMKLGISLGLSYTAFLSLVTAVCYALIYRTIKKYTNNMSYVYLMYLLHPVFLDIVQFRNFIIMSILVSAIPLLVEDTGKSKIKYLLLILVAASIQNLAIVYAPLLLVNRANKNKLVKYIACFIVLFSIVLLFNGNKIPYIENIVQNINNDRIDRYLSGVGRLGFLIAWGLHIIYFLLIYWSKKVIDRNKTSDKKNDEIIAFVNIVFWINVFAFAFFPLYMMDMAFYRVIRNLILVNAIVFSIASNSFASGNVKKLVFNFTVLLGASAWFSYDILGPHFITVFKPIFENNIFIGD